METIPEPTASDGFDHLEAMIQALIERHEALARENADLQARQRAWLRERAELVAKNAAAEKKLVAMIERLRALQ